MISRGKAVISLYASWHLWDVKGKIFDSERLVEIGQYRSYPGIKDDTRVGYQDRKPERPEPDRAATSGTLREGGAVIRYPFASSPLAAPHFTKLLAGGAGSSRTRSAPRYFRQRIIAGSTPRRSACSPFPALKRAKGVRGR